MIKQTRQQQQKDSKVLEYTKDTLDHLHTILDHLHILSCIKKQQDKFRVLIKGNMPLTE